MNSFRGISLRGRLPGSLWVPLLLLLLGTGYGLTVAGLRDSVTPAATAVTLTGSDLLSPRIATDHLPLALSDILARRLWQDTDWQPTPDNAGIGYLEGPATFRFRLNNTSRQSVERLVIVPAPFLDRITPALVHPGGEVERLPVMGATFPFRQRQFNLPQWVWSVTLAPESETILLFEVVNSGPTVFPVSLLEPDTLVSTSATTVVWKGFLYGMLLFALVFNITLVAMLRTPSTGWLTLLLFTVIYSQLVLDGFGLWLLWPDWPVLNDLLTVTPPLCMVALCQLSCHFLSLRGIHRTLLYALSASALVLLITTPLQSEKLPGQGTLLVLGVCTCLYTLGLAIQRFRENIYARYYGFAMLSVFVGVLLAALRTIGWIPVNELTNSAFYLGAALAAIVLTMAAARQLLEERRKRIGASLEAHQERQLRNQLKSDYDRLLKTHRITRKPNRPILEEVLDQLHRDKTPYTVCLIRLGRFTKLEQALGYKTTEDLLRVYLNRLDHFLKARLDRQSVLVNGHALATLDTMNHAFVLRTGGSRPGSDPVWTDIVRWLETTFSEGTYSFNWQPSLGLSHAPEHGKTATEVLSCAGFATLDSRHTITVYDPAIAERQQEQQRLMLDLDKALGNGQIYLAYQPKVTIENSRVTSCEALIRWQHPALGKVSPDRWIPLAEQVGAIHQVTLWVIHQACRDWLLLAARHGPDIAIAVNISGRDLDQPDFDQTALDIVSEHNLQPANLILEITETAVMSNPDRARSVIRALSRMGFRIALDDFGTGHSSLSALASFELDELKIDRSFLQNITRDATRQRIFRTAIELGEALGLVIVVEGVETEAVVHWLRQFPGLCGQGYFWGFPEPVARAGRISSPDLT